MYPNSQSQIPPPGNMNRIEGGYNQHNLYRDQKNIDSANQNFSNQKYSNNQMENPSNYGDQNNNLNHSFNPQGQISHNQQYPPQQSNQYFSQQQISSDSKLNRQVSSQSFNLPSQQNIPLSSQSIPYQQHPTQQHIGAPHPLQDQLDQNKMLKSNPINNIYQQNAFRQPSGASQALNATVHQQSQNHIQGLQTVGVMYRNPSIQSSEQLSHLQTYPSSANINPQKAAKSQNQGEDGLDILREEDLFGEEITESEESFWEYQSPEDWQHLLPTTQQQGAQNNSISSTNSRNKSKLGGIINAQTAQNQTQTKQNKKNQPNTTSNLNQQKEKDPFFGIDPAKIIVKDFPQGEDEESVFQWWDQIDEVYFPSLIKDGFFNMLEAEPPRNISHLMKNICEIEIEDNGFIKRIPPLKIFQTPGISTNASENSSVYYLMAKDRYKTEPIPFKQPNYITVLYYNQFNITQTQNDQLDSEQNLVQRLQQKSPNTGYLAIYKLKYYDKKRQIACEDKNIFDQMSSQLEIIPFNDKEKIEDVYQRSDYMQQISSSLEKSDGSKSKKISKSGIQREKQDLRGYEPNLTKQFIGNNQIFPISQFQQNQVVNQNQIGLQYDKNKVTIKLKKLISLDKLAIYSALQSTNFLNKFKKKEDKSISKKSKADEKDADSESETTSEFLKFQSNISDIPIESNIVALEYELTKLQADEQLNQLKQAVQERSKKEGNYLELRNLSVKINDNLKWLTIRKNLILGFSDRLAYDSENYFNYEAEEKSGINLSRSEIIKEKEMYERMSLAEQEKMSEQRQQTAANELQLKQQQQQQRMQRTKEKKEKEEEDDDDEEEDKQVGGKSLQKVKDKKQKSKHNEDNDEDEEDEDDEDDGEDEDQIQEDKRNRRRIGNRVKRIIEEDGNQPNLSNENSLDGNDNVHESDRAESPAINRNKNDDQDNDIKKSEQKNKNSSSNNNKKKNKKQKQKNKNKFLETDCSVCFHHVNNENNTVVYCSQCNGSFHKHCYGIDFIPEEKFLCKKCEYKNQQMMKRKSTNTCQKQPLKDEASKQFHCKLCTETLLPVVSIYDDSYFYHPTCLFIFNYAIYKDQSLQLRHNVTHQSIAEDIKKQNHITCEFCLSRKGLKVKCCHFGKPRKSYQPFLNSTTKKYSVFSKTPESKLQSNNQLILEKKEENIEEQKPLNESQHQTGNEENPNSKMEEETQTKSINESSEAKKEEDVKVEFQKEGEAEQQDQESMKQEEISSDDFVISEEEVEDDCEEYGCNYYIHPLCAFLNGLEIWLDSRDEDPECEQIIVDSDFQNLQHLGLKIFFKCKEHIDKRNRNYDEQVYYRRYQINYRNICQYTTFPEYQQSIIKQRTSEEEQWNEISIQEKEYIENYKYYTQIRLNRKEIEASYKQAELYYHQNPHLREQLEVLELEELEEEAAASKEQDQLQNQQHLQQQSQLNIEEDDEEGGNTPNVTQLMDEANTFDETENRTHMDDEDDDDENSQLKRRSKRNTQRKLLQLQSLSGNKNNQDIYDDDFDPLENELSQEDNKREGTRTRQFNQKRSSQRVQASQSSLSGGGQDANKNRRSRRLLHNSNSTKGKSQYSNFLNADDDDENQESSFNQGLSSFENTLNKVNLKENSNQGQEKQHSPKHQHSSSLALAQFTSHADKKHEMEQEEEFKGIQKKMQKHSNKISQKGKTSKSSATKYCEDADEEQEDEQEFEIDEDYFDYGPSQDEFQDDDYNEDEADDMKNIQKKGIGKSGNLKRLGARRQMAHQNEQSSSSLDHPQGRSHSRGASPPNKPNEPATNSTSNKQDVQKVLNHARSLAKNGKIGKGTSIFAVQNKKKKISKSIGSKGSLISMENDDEEDFDNEAENQQTEQDQAIEANPMLQEEDQMTRNPEQSFLMLKQQQELLNQKEIVEKSLHHENNNLEGVDEENNQSSSPNQNKMLPEVNEEDEIMNDTTSLHSQLTSKGGKQQKRSKSPQPKITQEQIHKQDLEGDSLKLQTQTSDNQQQTQTKYNLRKHQSKNYKNSSFIREDSDFINPHILSNPTFIQQQRQAFKTHGFNSESGQQNEEEQSAQIPQNTQINTNQNKKKQNSQTSIPHNSKGEIQIESIPALPKLKSKKNSKQSNSQQNIGHSKKGSENEQLQNEESSSSHAINPAGIQQLQNDIDFGQQLSLNSHQSQEDAHSNEQVVATKGKVQRKKQPPHRSEHPPQKHANKKSSTRSKQLIMDNEGKHGENSTAMEEEIHVQNDNQQDQQAGRIVNYQINNPKESQELLDFDQFEQQDQILNPNNLKFN